MAILKKFKMKCCDLCHTFFVSNRFLTFHSFSGLISSVRIYVNSLLKKWNEKMQPIFWLIVCINSAQPVVFICMLMTQLFTILILIFHKSYIICSVILISSSAGFDLLTWKNNMFSGVQNIMSWTDYSFSFLMHISIAKCALMICMCGCLYCKCMILRGRDVLQSSVLVLWKFDLLENEFLHLKQLLITIIGRKVNVPLNKTHMHILHIFSSCTVTVDIFQWFFQCKRYVALSSPPSSVHRASSSTSWCCWSTAQTRACASSASGWTSTSTTGALCVLFCFSLSRIIAMHHL